MAVPESSAGARAGYEPSTGKLVAAVIAAVWGVGVVINSLSALGDSGAYANGRTVAVLFGAALVVFGVRQLALEIRSRQAK